MSTNYGTLVRHCVAILDRFCKESQALEEHITCYLDQSKTLEDSERNFVTEVFSGCVRYESIMRVVTDGFYARDGKKMLKSEENLYKVMCYLALFRLDELGMSHFRKFVSSQDSNKMHRFLNYFLDKRNLMTWIKDEWNKYYETGFVQTALLSPLSVWLPELDDLLLQMKEKIDNKAKPRKKQIQVTEVKPFNITQPRPRSVPVPEPIPKLQKHRPAPKSIYAQPTELDMLAQTRAANRRQAEERLMEAQRKQFACANPEKSSKTRQKLNNIMAQEERKLVFDKHRANPVPAFLTKEVPIKLNTAAILREGELYKKRESEEIKRLEKLEAGAKDPSDFLKWQSEMRQKDLDTQLWDIERRRLEGKLSHEEAILARQNLIKDNKQKVQDMKEEAQEMMHDYLEQRFKEEQEMRQLVEDTMMGHKNAKEAQKKLQEYKQKLVQEVNEESKELMKLALEEAEIEMMRKMELIHQIRAMESVPVIRHKFVDLTETSGAGLLGEMSIAELRERLTLLKTASEEDEELRRDEILASKQAKNQNLMDTLEKISKHRVEQSKAAALKQEDKKKVHNPSTVTRDDKLTELHRRLEEKKSERQKEQEKSKIVPNRQSTLRTKSLITQKKALEENRWKELERTREKTAQLRSQGILGSQGAGRLANPGIAMTT